jgi:hypothetical protein
VAYRKIKDCETMYSMEKFIIIKLKHSTLLSAKLKLKILKKKLDLLVIDIKTICERLGIEPQKYATFLTEQGNS